MFKPLAALLTASLVLAACGESRLNPRNWFGRSQEAPSLGPISGGTETRPLVASISALAIERSSSGAILRAEAVMPAAGWYDAALVAQNNGRPVDGVITYHFVATAPTRPVAVTNPGARTLVVATDLSNYDLEMTREIVVLARENSRRISR